MPKETKMKKVFKEFINFSINYIVYTIYAFFLFMWFFSVVKDIPYIGKGFMENFDVFWILILILSYIIVVNIFNVDIKIFKDKNKEQDYG